MTEEVEERGSEEVVEHRPGDKLTEGAKPEPPEKKEEPQVDLQWEC